MMKSALRGGVRADPRTVRAGNGSTRSRAIPATQVQRERSELGDIRQALAISRQDAQAAREHMQSLIEINSRLKHEVD